MDGGQILIRSKHLNANPRESLFNELILKVQAEEEKNVLSNNKYLTQVIINLIKRECIETSLGYIFGQSRVFSISTKKTKISNSTHYFFHMSFLPKRNESKIKRKLASNFTTSVVQAHV